MTKKTQIKILALLIIFLESAALFAQTNSLDSVLCILISGIIFLISGGKICEEKYSF